MRIFRVVTAVLLVLWCVLIFSLSSQNADDSSETSGKLTQTVISVIYPDFSEMDSERQEDVVHNTTFVIRKAAHFSIFAILGVLSFLSVVTYKEPNYRLKTLISVVFCIIYAITDELHQIFISGRSGEVRDVFIDSIGSVLAIMILSLIFKKNKFLKSLVGGKDA